MRPCHIVPAELNDDDRECRIMHTGEKNAISRLSLDEIMPPAGHCVDKLHGAFHALSQ